MKNLTFGNRRILLIALTLAAAGAIAVGAWLQSGAGGGAKTLSAAQALTRACDTLAEHDYDFTLVTTTDEGKIVTEIAASGNDRQAQMKGPHPSGAALAPLAEFVVKDGVLYQRFTADDNPNTWMPWELGREDYYSPISPPCHEPVAESDEPSGASEGEERRFIWQTDVDGNQWYLWVNDAGLPTRGEVNVTEGNKVVESNTLTFSDIGQPNTITAPIPAPE